MIGGWLVRESQGLDDALTEVALITIGITCFNAADTVSRAIECAVKQDWPNKEIVVVDDCSTDATSSILASLTADHPELRVFREEPNRGVAAARNRILAEARGEFIAFFDDDDESRGDRLTKQWRRLVDYERIRGARLVLCYTNRDVVRGGQTTPDHVGLAIGREAPEPSGPIVANYLFGHLVDSHHVWGMLGSCTLMARRETFLAVGDFDESFRRCAEWDLAVRAAFRGAHFIAMNESLITQYKTATADKSGTLPLKYAVRLRRKHKEYLTKEKAYLATVAMAHAQFHGFKGRLWKSRFFLAVGYALLPPSILTAKLRSRFVRRGRMKSY